MSSYCPDIWIVYVTYNINGIAISYLRFTNISLLVSLMQHYSEHIALFICACVRWQAPSGGLYVMYTAFFPFWISPIIDLYSIPAGHVQQQTHHVTKPKTKASLLWKTHPPKKKDTVQKCKKEFVSQSFMNCAHKRDRPQIYVVQIYSSR